MLSKSRKVLLLNSSFEPITVVSIKKAIVMYFLDKVDFIEKSEQEIKSISLSLPIPHVIKLKKYIYLKPLSLSLTRTNIFKRDNKTCQYCGSKSSIMTIDHIIPKDKGGKDSWTNLVAACKKCNLHKANFSLKDGNMNLFKSLSSHLIYFICKNISINILVGINIFIYKKRRVFWIEK